MSAAAVAVDDVAEPAVGAPPAARPRTLIHFKKNSRHAVGQALGQLRWTEMRLRIPKLRTKKTTATVPSAAGRATPTKSTPSSSPSPSPDEEEEEEEDGGEGDEGDEEEMSASAAAMADVHSRVRKVKQPKAMLLNLHAYTAVHPATGQTASAAGLQWDMAWVDVLSEAEYRSLGRGQRVNQFPLMHRLTKKKYLALHLNTMRRHEPEEYAFYPQSWVLPQELQSVKDYYTHIAAAPSAAVSAADSSAAVATPCCLASTPILIVKPDFACEGKGIYIVDKLAQIDLSIPLVVQQYVARPLLLDGIKFDLRLYCLVTSVQPLSIFLFDDGLTRFCTEPYVPPTVGSLGSSFQHLTNYAINKKNENFVYNTDAQQSDFGSKWSVKSLLQKLKSEGRDVDLLWRRICDLVNKSVLSSYGPLLHAYRTTFAGALDTDGGQCFQFLGFDVMIDEEMMPILIEINRNCSLKCDTPLDARIKVRAIAQTLQIADPRASYRARPKDTPLKDRETMRGLSGAAYKVAQAAQQQAKYDARLRHEDACVARYAAQEQGGFQRIYPTVLTHAAHADEAAATAVAPSAYHVERQAVYDRLMQISIASHTESKKKAAPTAAAARRTLSERPTATKLRTKAAFASAPAPNTEPAAEAEDE